jgi:tRNA dimethylallyltransferase
MDAVAILGPTASGKSRLGLFLGRERNGEILSIDSRQAYIGLDIGTSKPVRHERNGIPHHLIDVLEPTKRNNAERYAAAAREAMRAVLARGRLPILVGGSGLYLRAVFDGLFVVNLSEPDRRRFERSVKGVPTELLHRRLCAVDGETSARIHRNDRYRIVRALEVYELTGIPLSRHFERQVSRERTGMEFLKIGLSLSRERLYERIDQRTEEMIAGGWIEEVRGLLESGLDPLCPGLRTLGYPEIISHIRGKIGKRELIETIQRLTRQYAKRQLTWFRKEKGVNWLDAESEDLQESVLRLVDEGRKCRVDDCESSA